MNRLIGLQRLGDDLLHDVAAHIGQPEVAPRVAVGRLLMVEPQQVKEDANLSISPGIGDVTVKSRFGVGSTSVVVNATTTFTLTVNRGSESTNAQTTVQIVTGVAPGWRLIEDFDLLSAGHIGGQGNWQNALSSISGALSPANVLSAADGMVLGFDGANVLAATALKSMSIPEETSNMLFFRFHISPAADLPSPVDALIPEIDINLGLTDKGLRDVQDFRGLNKGPAVRIFRSAGGAAGPIDLQANNGVNNALGGYSSLTDSTLYPTGSGLEVGKVYKVWIDIENRPFNVVVVEGVTNQNGGDLFSLYIQREGDPARTNLFQNCLSDRDGVFIDAVPIPATPTLTHLFFCANNQVTPQGTNTVRFDDFFLSTSGFDSSMPAPVSSFVLLSEQIRVTGFTYNLATASLTLTWAAIAGQT